MLITRNTQTWEPAMTIKFIEAIPAALMLAVGLWVLLLLLVAAGGTP